MTIFELGALGEFLGSFAVAASLIVLIFQIRQNTLEWEKTAHRLRLQLVDATH